jgi:hypothetical protein
MHEKRSDGWRRGIAAAFLTTLGLALGTALGTGCGGIDAFHTDMEDIVEPSRLKYENTNLSASALEERMKEIDASFAEPRTPAKVKLSHETSMQSISKVNGYAALWRGARACAWLARNDSDRSERKRFAEAGMSMGKEAVKRSSTLVESYYYYALSLGAFAELKGTPTRDTVREMRDTVVMALALDPKYDHCGPHRFLGLLMVKSADFPLYAVGTTQEGLKHLETATTECSDYAENNLVYAEALKLEGQYAQAREELEKVIVSARPKDRSAEHDAWLEQANELLQDLQGS